MNETTVDALVERYDAFFLDAYGVLVDSSGAAPGAAELLARLRRAGKKLLLLSNDASRLPATTVNRYRAFGLDLEEEDVLTSGMLIAGWFAREGLFGAPCVVLGTDDAKRFVEQAGGVLVSRDDAGAEVFVVADDSGYPFLEGIEEVLTTLIRRLDRGEEVRLLLPNPDLIYPKGGGAYGLASGSAAQLLEQGLSVRYPGTAPRFIGLGKPHPAIFDVGLERLGGPDRSEVVMLGDQLGTDILGAHRAGIDSVLVTTGLTQVADPADLPDPKPTWILRGLPTS